MSITADRVGLYEWVALPDLGLSALRAKIDTGATNSALHASDIREFRRNGQRFVRFNAHFGTQVHSRHACEAPLIARRTIRSSNGHTQNRYVIRTSVALGHRLWPVEITLTCRRNMRFRMLLGARALQDGQWLVDPAGAYLQDKPHTLTSGAP